MCLPLRGCPERRSHVSFCGTHAGPHAWFSLANKTWAEEKRHFQAQLEEPTCSSPFSLFFCHELGSVPDEAGVPRLGSPVILAWSCGRSALERSWEWERNLCCWSLCSLTGVFADLQNQRPLGRSCPFMDRLWLLTQLRPVVSVLRGCSPAVQKHSQDVRPQCAVSSIPELAFVSGPKHVLGY